MGSKYNEKQVSKIISDYTVNQNLRETARMNKVAVNTVKNMLKAHPDIAKVCEKKQFDNTQSTLEYMDKQHKIKKELVANILEAMNTKSLNLDLFTNIRDLATAYGIIIDKELKIVELDLKRQELTNKNK
jgi:virulence-associated protein VapD